jgi:GAF domain-containing protein
MDETGFEVSVAAQLQDLVIDTGDVTAFLQELSEYAAEAVAAGGVTNVLCAVTLVRRKRPLTIAGSTPEAKLLDEVQQGFGGGPCLEAMESGRTVLVQDTRTDTRWPDYCRVIAEGGHLSVLGVPLSLDEGATAALNFFAPEVDAFREGARRTCELFARHAEKALRLAVRIGVKQQLVEDLRTAMESRAAIDLASGVIMAQNRCSREEAFEVLRKASSHRNRKLREVAEEIVRSISGMPSSSNFDD